MDVQIPLEVGGLRQTVSDTVGIGGLMKGLRTIPAMLDIARDMEETLSGRANAQLYQSDGDDYVGGVGGNEYLRCRALPQCAGHQ